MDAGSVMNAGDTGSGRRFTLQRLRGNAVRPCDEIAPLRTLRETRPVVYQITNFVSAQLQADVTALFGGCPVMTRHPDEALDVAERSDSVLINVGTPNEGTPSLCRSIAERAHERNIPLVLDINGCGFTSFRSDLVDGLLRDFSFAVVRGNAGEIAALAREEARVRGMSGSASAEVARDSVATLSEKFRTTVVATGAVSLISANGETVETAGGDAWLSLLSGWGCALGSLIALLCAVAEPFEAARTALEIFRCASSRASEGAAGIGAFRQNFWDELSRIAEDKA